jgi:hypothetical protein
MNEIYCEKEEQVIAALSGNSRDAAILTHARSCPVCSEVLLVTGFLREEANLARHELNTLPDPALIWRRAQATAREAALVRATLPIRIARISALVVAVFVAPWLIFESRYLQHWMADLWPTHSSSAGQPLSSYSGGTTLLLALTGTLICIGLSSWYLLRED